MSAQPGRPSLGPRVATALRLPVDLHARLAAVADERDVSVNYLATKAIRRYLDALPPLPPEMMQGRWPKKVGVDTVDLAEAVDEDSQ